MRSLSADEADILAKAVGIVTVAGLDRNTVSLKEINLFIKEIVSIYITDSVTHDLCPLCLVLPHDSCIASYKQYYLVLFNPIKTVCELNQLGGN